MAKTSGKPKSKRLLELVRRQGVIRPKDLEAIDVPREYLRRLHAQGMLEHPGRGLYVAADAQPTENQTLVEACAREPHGVVCLLSALEFHGIGTQIAHEVWMAIGGKFWRPRLEYPPLRFVRFSERALQARVEEHRVDGGTIRVFGAAKTVADRFKYRNKIGLDVALEALRDCWPKRQAAVDEFCRAAEVCRVGKVMRPYLESVIT